MNGKALQLKIFEKDFFKVVNNYAWNKVIQIA